MKTSPYPTSELNSEYSFSNISFLSFQRFLKPGPTLLVKLPSDVQFYDLMGNCRRAERKMDGRAVVPLTAAPLFVTTKEAAELARAFDAAEILL